MREGDVYGALRRLSRRLDGAGIEYAVIGGMALVAHGFRRFTEDIDVLMTRDGLARFRQSFLGKGYVPAFKGAQKSFRDTEANVRVEVVTSGEYPGDGKPKPVSFPNPTDCGVAREGISVVSLEKLIELKLASGLSAPHRMRDIADVQDLIARLQLSLDLSQDLDPSVRGEYERLWKTVRSANER